MLRLLIDISQHHQCSKFPPIKRQTGQKQEQDPVICCIQETHLTIKDRYSVKKWKEMSQANGPINKASVAPVSDKMAFKFKLTSKRTITARKICFQ